MTISRIRLTNVRSHESTDIALSPGLSVIFGSSDSGKSNIVRSLVACSHPSPAASFVRDGFEEGKIVVEFADGKQISVVRKSHGKGEYVASTKDAKTGKVSRRSLTNPGRSLPDDWIATVGLGPTRIAGIDILLNIQTQREAAILVDDPAGRVAKIIGAASGASIAMEASGRAKTDAASAARDFDTKSKMMQDAESRLSAAESDPAIINADKIESLVTDIESTERDIARDAKARDAALDIVATFDSSIDIESMSRRHDELSKSIADIKSLLDKIKAAKSKHEAVESFLLSLTAIPEDAESRSDQLLLRIAELNNQLAAMSRKCPTCGRPMDNQHAHK